MLIGLLGNSSKGMIHDYFQFLRDLLHTPEETLQILKPLEVTHCHTTRICHDIWNNKTSIFKKKRGARGGVWPLTSFRTVASLYAISICCRNHPFCGSRNQDITRKL